MLGHIAVAVLVFSILAPLSSWLMQWSISLSGSEGLTDISILNYLVSPIGLIALSIGAAILLTVAIFEMAVLLRLIHTQGAIVAAIRHIAGILPRIVVFAVHILLRVVIYLLPVVIASAVCKFFLLQPYDINYYLTYETSAMDWSLLIVGVAALFSIIIILYRSPEWLSALAILVCTDTHAQEAFLQARDSVKEKKLLLFKHFTIILMASTLVSSVLGFVFAIWVGSVLPELDFDIKSMVTLLLITLTIWLIVTNAVSAITIAMVSGASYYHVSDKLGATYSAMAPRRNGYWVLGMMSLVGVASAINLTQEMMLKSDAIDHPVEIIAHRGGADQRPENTMAAIRHAIVQNADWIEIDVQEDADGRVVVIHDSDFSKIAKDGTKVWDADSAYISRLDIGSWFDPQYASERIPTLDEVLKVAKGKINVLVELKYYGHDIALAQKVVDLVESHNMQKETAYMSLNVGQVKEMQALRPNWNIGLLAAIAIGDIEEFDADFLALSSGSTNYDLVANTHKLNKKYYVWTTNDKFSMMSALSNGADGLITDKPALAHQVIAERAGLNKGQRFLIQFAEIFGIKDVLNDYYKM